MRGGILCMHNHSTNIIIILLFTLISPVRACGSGLPNGSYRAMDIHSPRWTHLGQLADQRSLSREQLTAIEDTG